MFAGQWLLLSWFPQGIVMSTNLHVVALSGRGVILRRWRVSQYLSMNEIEAKFGIKRWRLYQLSRTGKLPVKTLSGLPVIPFQIDVEAFQNLISTAQGPQRPSSLKTERKSDLSGPRKVQLWPKTRTQP